MENKQKRAPNVDQKMFDCVKILTNSGASREEIMKYTGLGLTTITRIRSVETYKEYLNMMAAMALEQRERKAKEKKKEKEPVTLEPADQGATAPPAPTQTVEHKQTVTVQTTYYVSQKLDKMTELLTGISAKLACIIDDLYGTGKKKEEYGNG